MPILDKRPQLNIPIKLFLAALALRLIWFVIVYLNGADWFVHDSKQFLLLSSNMLEHGEFSRSLAAPFFPDIARTPGYPLFLIIFQKLGLSVGSIAFIQMILSAFIPPFIFSCAKQMNLKKPTLSAWLLIFDFSIILFAPMILSDSLFLFLLVFWFWIFLQSANHQRYVFLSGLALGAMILVRPIAQFLPIVLIFWWLWQKMSKRVLIVMVAGILILPAAWMTRNYVHFQTFTLSSMGSNNLLLYNAAGIQAEVNGQDLTTSQSLLARSAKATQDWENDPLATKKYLDHCKSTAIDIILEHPLTFVKQTAISAALMPIKPPRSYVDLVLGLDYKYAPIQGLTTSKSLKEKLISLWNQTSMVAVSLTIYQLILNVVVFALALIATIKNWKHNHWISLLVMIILYFWITSLVTQPDARFRMPMGIFIALLAGNSSIGSIRTWLFGRPQKNPHQAQ